MSNPAEVTITKGQWVKIATNVIFITVHRLKNAKYGYTYRLTGESAPTLASDRREIFTESSMEQISYPQGIDVYMYCTLFDGKVSVDVYAGNILSDSVSPFGALTILQIENDKVMEGVAFSIDKRLAIGASSVNDIVIDPTSCPHDYLVFLPEQFKAFGAGPINIDIYSGTDVDNDGTVWESQNRNHESSNTSDVIVRLNPTINSVGTKMPLEFVVLSDGTAATAVAGGESKPGQVWNMKKDVKYLFRLTNTEAVAASGHVSFNWFETDI